ncbi:Rhamnogalacturonate lyase [Linum perenne]
MNYSVTGTDYKVITEKPDVVEVSFSRTWSPGQPNTVVPLNVDMRFNYMAITDEIQLVMPTEADRQAGKPLAYKEAVKLTNPVSNPAFKDQVDDKYEYTLEKTELKLKGWVSDSAKIGFWVIAPSDEYMNGGPKKNDLTCHCGPTVVVIFTSIHTFGLDLLTEYRNGEPWKKAFGPILVYLNSDADHSALWKDAKSQGYNFWTQTDDKGNFVIKNVRPGDYNLYGYVIGVVSSFRHPQLITVKAGDELKLGQVAFKPPRTGPTLWEIGIPDRSANEFFVPDADPNFVNKFWLDKPKDKYRQYGLWLQYPVVYPKDDVVFQVGVSNYSKDWFFAHVLRADGKTYNPTIWKVYVNDVNAKRPHYATGTCGTDNAIARHGNHGLYRFFSGGLPSNLFLKGKNTIFMRQARSSNYAYAGVIVDGTDYKVITEKPDVVEVSFSRTWRPGLPNTVVPLNVDMRYIVRKDVPGFYVYVIVERLQGWPDVDMNYHRYAFKPNKTLFNYMAITDEIQLVMPTEADREAGTPLAYKEAVKLTNPVSNPAFKDQVDDKYEYTLEKTQLKLKGWISDSAKLGFWIVAPSDEYMNGGPKKNDLTCHCGPTVVVIFTSIHTFGLDLLTEYRNGEPWKKAFGPVFIYLNADGDRSALWKDAKSQGYNFWTQTDDKGNFVIKNVRPGDYNLYGYVIGVVSSFRHPQLITVKAGDELKLGQVAFKPPRTGPTLWEIGIPDRSANEFFVPDADPGFLNKFWLDKPKDKYRQYGLWARYAELYPKDDLVFQVGVSTYSKDWFYAHVLREVGKTYNPTTWRVVFDLPEVIPTGNYTIQIALAAAEMTNIFVYVNDVNAKRPHYATGTVGTDNAIARHGNHGLYRFFSGGLPSNLFLKGKNTIFMRHAKSQDSPFSGVMYDYIRLEAPSSDPVPKAP